MKANLYKGECISRIPVVSYRLSKELKKRIFDSITRGDYRPEKKFREKIIEDFPKKRVHIALPRKYAARIRDLAVEVAARARNSEN